MKLKLKALREERGVSREQLAVTVGTTYSNIVSLELGRSKPSLDLAQRIAEYYHVSTDDIDWGAKPDDDTGGKDLAAEVA